MRAETNQLTLKSDPGASRPPERRSGYIPVLDGWRAVAIIGVLICHGCEPLFHPGGAYSNPLLYRSTRYGSFGVDIFFGISGFIICSRLLQENRQTGSISLPSFYIRRAFRILPPYLMYLTVVGLLSISGVLVLHRAEWISCLLFLRNYLPERQSSWYLAHFWSLAVEEHFYLIWPGILICFGARRARWVAVSLAMAVAGWRTLDGHVQWISRTFEVGFYSRTDIRLDALLWACWMALLIERADWRKTIASWTSAKKWAVLVGALACAVSCGLPLAMLWQAMLVPLVLVGTVLQPIKAVSRVLESGAIRWIGRISYSLYIWQQFFLLSSAERRISVLGILQMFPFNVVCVFAAAIASYYLVERPLIGYGYALSRRVARTYQADSRSIGLGVATIR